MKNPLQNKVQREAFQMVFVQAVFVFILSLIGLLFYGKEIAVFLLAGGFAYVLPNLIFVWRVFRYSGAQQMVAFMVAFFVGESLKLIFSAFLVLLIVKYLPHSLLSVLIGYIGSIVSFWFACLWHMVKEAKAKQQVLW